MATGHGNMHGRPHKRMHWENGRHCFRLARFQPCTATTGRPSSQRVRHSTAPSCKSLFSVIALVEKGGLALVRACDKFHGNVFWTKFCRDTYHKPPVALSSSSKPLGGLVPCIRGHARPWQRMDRSCGSVKATRRTAPERDRRVSPPSVEELKQEPQRNHLFCHQLHAFTNKDLWGRSRTAFSSGGC